ncbi:MAG: hypothetical protein ACJ76N_09465 [Thermoanaerobaculia bacterium]
MNNHDVGDHGPKLSLPIDEETARCWLHGEGDPLEIQAKIFKGSLRWLYFHSRGLSVSVLEEIVWVAMAEAFSDFCTLKLSVHDALISLQKSLNRLRAREDRRRRIEIPQGELVEERADSRNDHEELFDRDYWVKVARLIERHLTGAMLSLSSRDMDILACSYGLEDVGDPVRPAMSPVFSSADTKKKAVTRARKRFSQHLESLLVADLELVPKFDRPLYEDALRLVRGGKIHRVLAVLESRGHHS